MIKEDCCNLGMIFDHTKIMLSRSTIIAKFTKIITNWHIPPVFAVERKKKNRDRWRAIAKKRKRGQGQTLGANFRKNFVKFQSFVKENPSALAEVCNGCLYLIYWRAYVLSWHMNICV